MVFSNIHYFACSYKSLSSYRVTTFELKIRKTEKKSKTSPSGWSWSTFGIFKRFRKRFWSDFGGFWMDFGRFLKGFWEDLGKILGDKQ